jgi:predicted acyl esterase
VLTKAERIEGALFAETLRGSNCQTFAVPSVIPARNVQECTFRLPAASWTFLPDHRIMV